MESIMYISLYLVYLTLVKSSVSSTNTSPAISNRVTLQDIFATHTTFFVTSTMPPLDITREEADKTTKSLKTRSTLDTSQNLEIEALDSDYQNGDHGTTIRSMTGISTANELSYEFTNKSSPESSTMTNHSTLSTTTEGLIMHVDECKEYGSCPDPGTLWYCHCDDVCHIYNDCCQDFETPEISTDNIYTCMRMNNEDNSYSGIFVIASCPADYDNLTMIEKCLNTDIFQTDGLPVFDNGNGSNIFSNKFCALCNGIKNTSLMGILFYGFSAKTELRIMPNDTDFFEKYKTFKYSLMVKTLMKPRYCVSRLKVSGSPECNRYINPIITETKVGRTYVRNAYRNSKCLWDQNEKFDSKACLPRPLLRNDWKINSLSVFFNFGGSSDTEEGMCKVWTEEVDELCSRFPSYSFFPEMMGFTISAAEHISELSDDFLFQVALITLSSFEVPGITLLHRYRQIHIMKANNEPIVLNVEFLLQIQKRCFWHELIEIKNTLIERNITINISNAAKGNATLEFRSTNTNFSDPSSHIKTINTNLNIPQYFRIFSIEDKSVDPPMVCKDITILAKKVEEKLIIVDYICTQNMYRRERESSVLATTSYVCFTVSAVALVPLVVVNRKLDRSMTVPRTNVENVSISMMIANIIFLFGIGAMHEPLICYVVAILLHYLFLMSFVFMTIGVISVARAVTGLRLPNTRDENTNRNRLLVTILGLLIPIGSVGPAVVIDRVGPAEWSPGYGQTACFPTRFPGNVAFFSGPVILLLGINLACIIWIIIQVYRVRLETSQLLQKSSTIDDAMLYIRLIVSSGLLWIIGVVAVAVDSLWLEFVFTVSCGLQGLFLSVGGLTTQEVRRKLCISIFTSRTNDTESRRNVDQNN